MHKESTVSLAQPGNPPQANPNVQSGLDGSPGPGKTAEPTSEPGSDLPALTDQVVRAKREMLEERRRAERTGKSAGKSEAYRDGVQQERQGNQLAKSGTRDGLKGALLSYNVARDSYRNAAGAGMSPVPKSPPDTRKAESNIAAQGIPGSGAEKPPATRTEQQPAEESKNAGAGSDASTRPSTPEAPSTSGTGQAPAAGGEAKQTPQTTVATVDANVEAAARNEIGKLLQQYREGIERGDVSALDRLLNLSDQAESNWSLFFSSSENRKLSIEGVNMDIDGSNARVSFKAKMSFFNNQTNAPQNSENARQWTLESEQGTWRIITQK